jgi:hypothetical protein
MVDGNAGFPRKALFDLLQKSEIITTETPRHRAFPFHLSVFVSPWFKKAYIHAVVALVFDGQ